MLPRVVMRIKVDSRPSPAEGDPRGHGLLDAGLRTLGSFTFGVRYRLGAVSQRKQVTEPRSGVHPTLEGTRLDVAERLGVYIAQFAEDMAGGCRGVVECVDPSDGGGANTVTGTIPAASSGASGNRVGTSAAGATTTDLVQLMTL
jgi:hypothetical protein